MEHFSKLSPVNPACRYILTCEFRLYTCEFRLYTCEFRLYTCEFRLYTCEFRLYTCKAKAIYQQHPVTPSDLRARAHV